MRKKNPTNYVTLAMVTTMLGITLLAGCGSDATTAETTIVDEQVALEAEPTTSEEKETVKADTSEYFTRGVYVNYSAEAENPDKTYFYVFEGDGCGHIEDGATNTGMFFLYEQADGAVKFKFGSEDPTEDTFTIKTVDNGVITGNFEDTIDLVFEPVADVDVDTFDAVNYVNAANGEDFVYTDPNGWRIKYDPDKFVVTSAGPMTTIVYVGESAGTNMITVNYTLEKAEDAINELGKPYGDKAYFSQGPFPGKEDVTGYWVTVTPDTAGSGAYMTAMARDYMDGSLVFELDGHMGGDEAMDMEVSDALAAIIDSLEFPYGN
ncbi:MAG: hypothetical protein IKO76_01815 [Butyrivibrio sp.]|nr:hypothetical protein [Butyrivibrio sp.]